MTVARFAVGDVADRLAEIPDDSVDLIITSPPFLALRSYLPVDHPLKDAEIGSEPDPATFLDVLLGLTVEWGRVLAPHGSIAVELGDTYAGSGGAGGDYNPGGLREGQDKFDGSGYTARQDTKYPKVQRDDHAAGITNMHGKVQGGGTGWPLAKSLCLLPELYAASLAYGRNLLRHPPTGHELIDFFDLIVDDLDGDLSARDLLSMMRSHADQHAAIHSAREFEPWRVRNLKPWIRTNPPVGTLGDKERPATSYVIVATRSSGRYFDLDAVRCINNPHRVDELAAGGVKHRDTDQSLSRRTGSGEQHPDGAPPLDWWHHVDGVLDHALREYAKGSTHARGKPGTKRPNSGKSADTDRGGQWFTLDTLAEGPGDGSTVRGWHLRRALERAGILTTLDAVQPGRGSGYSGRHFAVFPPQLVSTLLEEMAPRHVCRTCGEPRRRIVETEYEPHGERHDENKGVRGGEGGSGEHAQHMAHGRATKHVETIGWTHCGCGDGCRPTTWTTAETVLEQVNVDGEWIDAWELEPDAPGKRRTKKKRRRVVDDIGHCADAGHHRPGLVLDPFVGSGTTLVVATGHSRDAVGIDIDERNADLAMERLGPLMSLMCEIIPAGEALTWEP